MAVAAMGYGATGQVVGGILGGLAGGVLGGAAGFRRGAALTPRTPPPPAAPPEAPLTRPNYSAIADPPNVTASTKPTPRVVREMKRLTWKQIEVDCAML